VEHQKGIYDTIAIGRSNKNEEPHIVRKDFGADVDLVEGLATRRGHFYFERGEKEKLKRKSLIGRRATGTLCPSK